MAFLLIATSPDNFLGSLQFLVSWHQGKVKRPEPGGIPDSDRLRHLIHVQRVDFVCLLASRKELTS
jgi:hypothetical protein